MKAVLFFPPVKVLVIQRDTLNQRGGNDTQASDLWWKKVCKSCHQFWASFCCVSINSYVLDFGKEGGRCQVRAHISTPSVRQPQLQASGNTIRFPNLARYGLHYHHEKFSDDERLIMCYISLIKPTIKHKVWKESGDIFCDITLDQSAAADLTVTSVHYIWRVTF